MRACTHTHTHTHINAHIESGGDIHARTHTHLHTVNSVHDIIIIIMYSLMCVSPSSLKADPKSAIQERSLSLFCTETACFVFDSQLNRKLVKCMLVDTVSRTR